MVNENIYKGLNDPQMSAVKNFDGPTLIIAGAGSGKTKTLTCRIAYMIQNGVKPWQIMALTFTNKAAKEMRARIGQTLPADVTRGLQMGTFHGVFRQILSKYCDKLGFKPDYTIYDKADSTNLLKSIIKELQLSDEHYKPNLVSSRISLAKNNLVLPSAYSTMETVMQEDREMRCPRLHEVYAKYFSLCKRNGAMDFDDILLYMNILLRDHPEVVAELGEKFKYILVDEYQDTNRSQYMILRKLTTTHNNICVVGDDSQSIYSFRGAKIENILKFQNDYSEAKLIKLEQNYRSTQTIVNAANSLINHNTQKLQKTLFSASDQGAKITVIEAFNDRMESDSVVRSISHKMRVEDCNPADFAILYRTNSQSRIFEDTLRHRNIAYRIYGGKSFYQREEIKDLVSYLNLYVNNENDIAFRRVVNKPKRGIGDASIEKIAAAAAHHGISMYSATQNIPTADMGIRGGDNIRKFMTIFKQVDELGENATPYEIAYAMAHRSGMIAAYENSSLPEEQSRIDNIEELLSSIKEYSEEDPEQQYDDMGEEMEPQPRTIATWLAEISLLTDQDEKEDTQPRVTLLTVHASKGLEFKHTFIVGLEEQLFPSNRAGSLEELEEERRIFYVALTRAEKSATISYAQSRFKYGNTVDCTPSRFIEEIDSQYLDRDEGSSDSMQFGRKPMMGGAQNIDSGSIAEKLARLQQQQQNNPNKTTRFTPRPTPQPVAKIAKIAPRPAPVEYTKVAQIDDLEIGTEVQHARFGNGTITKLEKTPDDVRITVNFGPMGEKMLLQRFAKLKVL